ncbi:MAG TPA: methyltransferase domain-containing protein [Ktedonobacterales bacterium]|nr:methyltransferase domain-containing protein [Ktedonobacterales bacterium]
MPQKFDTRKKYLLLSEERQTAIQPETLLRDLGLTSGDTLADIGCGPGFFTIPAAQIVGPEGLVMAADIQGEMLTAVRSRAAEMDLHNVHVVKTSETEIPIRPGSCDMALLAFTLHEIDNHAIFLHRAARTLKPSGRLVVMEWEKREQESGPPYADRLAPEDLLADAQAAGLRLADRRSVGDDDYLCVFTRAEATFVV